MESGRVPQKSTPSPESITTLFIDYSTFEEHGAFYEYENVLKKIMERTASHDPNAYLVEDDKVELALQNLYMDEVEARRDAAQEYDMGNEYDAYKSPHGDLLIKEF